MIANALYAGALILFTAALHKARKLGFAEGIRASDIWLHKVGLDKEFQERFDKFEKKIGL